MIGVQIPRFLRTSLFDDPDEEAKLAAFRAHAYGGAAPAEDGTSAYFGWPLNMPVATPRPDSAPDTPYLDYTAAFPQPNPQPLPEPRFADTPTEGPLGPYLDYSRSFPRPNPKPLPAPRFADMPTEGPLGPDLDYSRRLRRYSPEERQLRQGAATAGLRTFGNETLVQGIAGVSEAVHNTLRALPGVEQLEKYVGYQEPKFAKPETVAGELIRDTARFLTGFVPIVRVMRGIATGTTATSMAAAGLSEFLTRNPIEDNLFDLLEKHTEIGRPVYRYLQDVAGLDRNDVEGMRRAENALIGAVVAGPLDRYLGPALVRIAKLVGISRRIGVTAEELVIDGVMGLAHTATEKNIHDALPHADEPRASGEAIP
jgi:hypothetical protein